MQRTVCGKCGLSWPTPDMFNEAMRRMAASWVRAGRIVIAMKVLTADSWINLHDAKAIAVHITQELGTCHECSYPLTGEATDHCPFCQAVNYDW
jgi:rubrerythrin